MLVITAGHSDKDSGAVGFGLREEDLAEKLRDIIASKLEAEGIKYVTDGKKGENLPLTYSAELIRIHKPKVALELHFNAGSSSATGVECIAQLKDKKLAQDLSQAVGKVLNIPVRRDKGFMTQEDSHRGKLLFIQRGGLILEVAFISNKNEMENYQSKVWMVATAIVNVLKGYL